jgi:CelD/BcsL family acetyltransferase involved in cellulose biosynthesis
LADVKILRTFAELCGCSDQWNALLKKSAQDNVFLTWEWISIWVDVYLCDRDLLAIAVFEDEELVALAPFWVETRRYKGLLPVKVLRIVGSPESDYVDLIVTPDGASGNSQLIWEQLFGPLRDEWDVFDYVDVPYDSPVLAAFQEIAGTDDRCLGVETTGHSVCPYIDLPASWEEFLSGFSRSGRYTLTYSGRRLEQQGALDFRICDNIDDVDLGMTDFISLHQKNWTEKGKSGALATEASRDFHHRVAKAMFKKGVLFLASLRLDGNHIGSFYGFDYNSKVYYYLLGVEKNRVKRVKTGTALLALCVQEAIKRGCGEFDLLRGAEEYKYRWTRLDRRNARLRFYNRSRAAYLTFALRRVRLGMRRMFGRTGGWARG